METIELKVAGMTCASCANSVSKALNRVPGVQDVRVDLTRGTASVDAATRDAEDAWAQQERDWVLQLCKCFYADQEFFREDVLP